MTFKLDTRLENDTHFVAETKYAHILLMNDSTYPWVIVVPKVANVSEIYELDAEIQQDILVEINVLSKALKAEYKADKINVAALGNVVKQLHIHVLGRFENDPCWPAPVWGKNPAVPYSAEKAEEICAFLRTVITSAHA